MKKHRLTRFIKRKTSRLNGVWTIILSVLLISLDSTFINVIILDIATDLNTGLAMVQKLISSYLLILGTLTLLGGKITDKYGSAKIFRVGILIFGLGSLVSGTAHSPMSLFLGWSVIEGIGASLVFPSSTAYVHDNFKGKQRRFLYAVMSAAASAGAAAGPLFGGFIATHWSWRYLFLIQATFASIIIISSLSLKKDKNTTNTPIDWFGALLTILGLGSIVWALSNVHQSVIIGTRISVPWHLFVVVGLIILGIFIMWDLAKENALIDRELLLNLKFLRRVLLQSLINIAQGGYFFILPVFLQIVLEKDPIQTALYIVPLGLVILVVSLISARLSFKDEHVLLTGFSLVTLGALYGYLTLSVNFNLLDIIILTTLIGSGIGLVISRLINYIMQTVPKSQAGQGAGIITTITQISISIGTATMGSIFFSRLRENLTPLYKIAPTKINTVNKLYTYAKMSHNNHILHQLKLAVVDATQISILQSLLFLGLAILVLITIINWPKKAK